MKKERFLYLFLLMSASVYSQKPMPFTIPLSGTVEVSQIREDWDPAVVGIEAPRPDGEAARLAEIKDSLMARYPRKNTSMEKKDRIPKPIPVTDPPVMGQNLQGNDFNSTTPNDNDLSISNDGKLVSVQNNNIFRYNTLTKVASPVISLSAFFGSLGNTQTKYDPKTIYDPVADRFIILCLAGSNSSTTNILVGFSKTSDPDGAWNLYSLQGNPLNDGFWTDFPMIALTETEVVITVNHLFNNMPWQTGFKRSVIWQIKKSNGYNGLPLNALLHSAINYKNKAIRNLCPVKGDRKLYGPDIYFLSNRNLDPKNDTVFLVHLTDTIGSSLQQITVIPVVSDQVYLVPPSAKQPGNMGDLQTNDSRVLNALRSSGQIQYVQNTLDTLSGFAAIMHGTIDSIGTNPHIRSNLIRDKVLEFGYPAISWAGRDSSEKTVFISFNHTGLTVFPGHSAIAWDGTSYSSLVRTKAGLGYINIINGDDRWGDYNGSQSRYNVPGEVWINGMFGKANTQHATWIAQLSKFVTGISGHANSAKVSFDISPNPFIDQFEIVFPLDKPEILSFAIFDMKGKLVKFLLEDRIKAGKNRFSFSGKSLARGTYTLRIRSAIRTITSKTIKIIKR